MRLYKLTVNCNPEELNSLEIIKTFFENLTNIKTTYVLSKRTNSSFGIKRGDKLGFTQTLYSKKASEFLHRFRNLEIQKSAISDFGKCDIGVKEYTHIRLPFNPDLPNFGLGIQFIISDISYGTRYRRRMPTKPIKVSKDDVLNHLAKTYEIFEKR